jgi:hypothetical protein
LKNLSALREMVCVVKRGVNVAKEGASLSILLLGSLILFYIALEI